MGEILIELNSEKAPISTKNFLYYVNKGPTGFDGTIFHRVIKDFMIQGGNFDKNFKPRHTLPGIKNEWQNGLKNDRGTIAMARVGGQPDSGKNQYFINVVDNAFLDKPQWDGAAYAVFGKVISGMDVVDKIQVVPTGDSHGHKNVPLDPVIVTTARVVE
eukprot:CAMPEP_0168518720 /NCGR_PEP_ID=MMETSP0405-20121227/6884_1 /TAXON_ID=498012 /ORGANISM="Trichosphaerium sp, Strain Am-I-7 wt" /LENGTH=158 /DNA_ID=CAMNT_0008539113 /DNA_START=100 /DNA_END=576 /DNA_ORIENTATION=-